MFFGFKRKKIVRAAMEHIRPLFRLTEMGTGHPPAHFAEDHYIIGFVVGASSCIARAASNDTLSANEIGIVTIEVIEGLFGKSGVTTSQLAVKSLKQGGDPEFSRGIGNGQKTVLVALGAAAALPTSELASDSDVKAAFVECSKDRPAYQCSFFR